MRSLTCTSYYLEMSNMADGLAPSSVVNGRSISYRALRPALPWQPLLVEDVVRRSPIRNANSRLQTKALVEAFNSRSVEAFGGVDSTVTTSWLRGQRVPPGDFVFFQRNQVPCMSQEHDRPLARCLTLNPAVNISRVRTVAKTEPVCSVLGSHIINVPVGYYARITTGGARQPELLDEVHDKQDNSPHEQAPWPLADWSCPLSPSLSVCLSGCRVRT